MTKRMHYEIYLFPGQKKLLTFSNLHLPTKNECCTLECLELSF